MNQPLSAIRLNLQKLNGVEITALYLDALRAYGDRIAVAEEIHGQWQSTSFVQFAEITQQMASYLSESSVKENTKVAFLSESTMEYIPTLLSIGMAGGIAIPLDVKLSRSELVSILEHSEASTLIVSQQFIEMGEKLLAEVPKLESLQVLKGQENSLVENSKNWPKKDFGEFPGYGQERTSLIVYTSGTTSNPKGVMLQIKNIVSQFEGLPDDILDDGKSRLMSILPLSHMYNLTCEMYGLFWGASIYYKKSLLPHELVETLEDKKITNMVCVPLVLDTFKRSIERVVSKKGKSAAFVFKCLLKFAGFLPFSLRKYFFKAIHQKFGGHLDTFLCGGAPLSQEAFLFFENMGFAVIQGYGLTETSPLCSFNRKENRVLNSVGKALKGVEIKIHLPGSKTKAGEILVRGDNVMNGYFKNVEETEKVMDPDGWFHTGDIGYFDKKQNLYIVGRSKSLIVLRGGKKVHPEEVENVIGSSDAVEEVCVLSLIKKDPITNTDVETVVAIAKPSLEFSNSYSEELLKGALEKELERQRTKLSDYKWPTEIFVVKDELPKSTTRKIKRNLVNELVQKLNQDRTL